MSDSSAGESFLRRTWPLLLLVTFGLLVGFRPIADMDFHWHLAMGEAWYEGELPAEVDPFTHLPTVRPPELGSTLADRLFAFVHRHLGLVGILWLIAALVAALYVQSYRSALACGTDRAGAMLVAAFFAAASIDRLQARPDLFSLLGFLVLLELGRRSSRWPTILAAFGVTAVWINLHPGALLAPLWLALGAFDRMRSAGASPAESRLPSHPNGTQWLIAALPAIAALLGLFCARRGLAFTLDLARVTAKAGAIIPEWAPLWELPASRFRAAWCTAVLGIAALVVAIFRRRRSGQPVHWLPIVAVAASLTSYRLHFMATAAVVAVASAFRLPRSITIVAALALALVPLVDRAEAARAARTSGIGTWSRLYTPNFPVGATDYLERTQLEGRLFHPPRWGGYLAWRLHPSYRTAHDGRVTLFDLALARDLQRFPDPLFRDALVRYHHLEILVLPPDVLPSDEIASVDAADDPRRRWLRLYDDGVAAVYLDLRGEHVAANRERLLQVR